MTFIVNHCNVCGFRVRNKTLLKRCENCRALDTFELVTVLDPIDNLKHFIVDVKQK